MEDQDIQSQIRSIEEKRFQSLIQKNFEQFYAMCDKDLRYIHTSGKVDDLKALLVKLESGYYDYLNIDYDIIDIVDRQDCVIVRADFYADIRVNDVPRKLQNRALSI